jgi:hypothetical protein
MKENTDLDKNQTFSMLMVVVSSFLVLFSMVS